MSGVIVLETAWEEGATRRNVEFGKRHHPFHEYVNIISPLVTSAS